MPGKRLATHEAATIGMRIIALQLWQVDHFGQNSTLPKAREDGLIGAGNFRVQMFGCQSLEHPQTNTNLWKIRHFDLITASHDRVEKGATGDCVCQWANRIKGA